MAPSDARHDSLAALRSPAFRLLTGGRFVALFGELMLVTAVGWEIYDRTGNALLLGVIGLVQVIPVFLLGLPAGYIVDKYDRRWIAVISQIALVVLALVLTLLSAARADIIWSFVVLMLIGAARAFHNPAEGAILP
ncbi:MAG: MFS transporter [Anaerolineae bacterium]